MRKTISIISIILMFISTKVLAWNVTGAYYLYDSPNGNIVQPGEILWFEGAFTALGEVAQCSVQFNFTVMEPGGGLEGYTDGYFYAPVTGHVEYLDIAAPTSPGVYDYRVDGLMFDCDGFEVHSDYDWVTVTVEDTSAGDCDVSELGIPDWDFYNIMQDESFCEELEIHNSGEFDCYITNVRVQTVSGSVNINWSDDTYSPNFTLGETDSNWVGPFCGVATEAGAADVDVYVKIDGGSEVYIDWIYFNVDSNCTPNWSCSVWSSCANCFRTRTCNDLNNCGVNDGKPAEIEGCTNCTDECFLFDNHCDGNVAYDCVLDEYNCCYKKQNQQTCLGACENGECVSDPTCEYTDCHNNDLWCFNASNQPDHMVEECGNASSSGPVSGQYCSSESGHLVKLNSYSVRCCENNSCGWCFQYNYEQVHVECEWGCDQDTDQCLGCTPDWDCSPTEDCQPDGTQQFECIDTVCGQPSYFDEQACQYCDISICSLNDKYCDLNLLLECVELPGSCNTAWNMTDCGTDSEYLGMNYCLDNNVVFDIIKLNKGCADASCYEYEEVLSIEILQLCEGSIEYSAAYCEGINIVQEVETISAICDVNTVSCVFDSDISQQIIEGCICGCEQGSCLACQYDTCATLQCDYQTNSVWCYDSNGIVYEQYQQCDQGFICLADENNENAECVEEYVPPIPEECEFLSAWWSKIEVIDGERVELIVLNNGYCDGEVISFVIYEEDWWILPDDFQLAYPFVTVNSTTTVVEWQAVFMKDAANPFQSCEGPVCIYEPEYYFEVHHVDSVVLDTNDTISWLKVSPYYAGLSLQEFVSKMIEELENEQDAEDSIVYLDCLSSEETITYRCEEMFEKANVIADEEEIKEVWEWLSEWWDKGWEFFDPGFQFISAISCASCSHPDNIGAFILDFNLSDVLDGGITDEDFIYPGALWGPDACEICVEWLLAFMDNPQIALGTLFFGIAKTVGAQGIKKMASKYGITQFVAKIDRKGLGAKMSYIFGEEVFERRHAYFKVGNNLKKSSRLYKNPIWIKQGGEEFIYFNAINNGPFHGFKWVSELNEEFFLALFKANKVQPVYEKVRVLGANVAGTYFDDLKILLREVDIPAPYGAYMYDYNKIKLGVNIPEGYYGLLVTKEEIFIVALEHEMGHFLQARGLIHKGFQIETYDGKNPVIEYFNDLFMMDQTTTGDAYSNIVKGKLDKVIDFDSNPPSGIVKDGKWWADTYMYDKAESKLERHQLEAIYNWANKLDHNQAKEFVENAIKQNYGDDAFDAFVTDASDLKQAAEIFNSEFLLPSQPSIEFIEVVEQFQVNHWDLVNWDGEYDHGHVDIGGFNTEDDYDRVFARKCDGNTVKWFDEAENAYYGVAQRCGNNEVCIDDQCQIDEQVNDDHNFIISILPEQPFAGEEAMLWPYALNDHCFQDVVCDFIRFRKEAQDNGQCFDIRYYFTIDEIGTYTVSCIATFDDGVELTKYETFEVVPMFEHDDPTSLPANAEDDFEIQRVGGNMCQAGGGYPTVFWLAIFVLWIISRRKKIKI